MMRASERLRRTLACQGRSLRLILPILSLALAIWACGAPPPTTHLPAAQLHLTITIIGQYGDNAEAEGVHMTALIGEGYNPEAHITCNGTDITLTYKISYRPCPRQPPGGSYVITYTDEHGATSITVPVPQGKLALLSPQAGSSVPIPHGAIDMVYEAPIAPPGDYVTLNDLSLECGDLKTYNCGDEVFTFTSTNGPVRGTTSGGKQPFHMTGDFSQFHPGPGRVYVTTTVHLTPESGGFAGVTATFQDNIIAPITWTN